MKEDYMKDEPLDHLSTNSSSNQSGSNDFVKKLYQMLQQDKYKNIVRWTKTGNSFVVIDTNEFTKDILPRHFKHSNFASFVRQLNKYDFHKVKISNEAKRNYEYGDDAWEFQHPEFRMNDREALDNIKRKGPTGKKPNNNNNNNSSNDPNNNNNSNNNNITGSNNGGNNVNNSDIKHLQDKFENLKLENKHLQQEINLLKSKYKSVVDNLVMIKSFNERCFNSMNLLINNLSQNGIKLPPLDFPNPNEDFTNHHQQQQQQLIMAQQMQTIPQQVQPLQPQQVQPPQVQQSQQQQQPIPPPNQSVAGQPDHKRLYSHSLKYQQQLPNQSPPNLAQNSASPPTTGPGGPQQQPSQPSVQGQPQVQVQQQQPPSFTTGTPNSNDQSPLESPRGVNDLTTNGTVLITNIPNPKFHVLLVEDDNVCIQLCRKFLVKYGCQVTVVTDGLNAISTVENHKYDLVLMDIVMPNLDGATATSVIRSFDTKTPIIAMTGNIEENDLVTYLQNGMSDILAKPFTKDDLYSILSKHLLGNDPVNVLSVNSDFLNDEQIIKKQRLE